MPSNGLAQKDDMSDMEQLSEVTESAAPEAALPSGLSQETTDTESTTDEAGLLATPESEDEELDVEGEKYRVPKTLAERIKELQQGSLRQDDYTRKTQTVAEQARAYEARAQELAAREQFQQQHIQAVAKVMAIDERLEQFSKLDWNAIDNADPVQSMKLARQMQELQQQRASIVSGAQQAQQQQTLAMQQATARQREQDLQMLTREIKGFGTPEVTKSLIESGMKLGYKPQELENMTDPRAMKAFDIVDKYYKLIAKQTAESKPKPAEVKPIPRVSPGSGAVKKSISDQKISMADFIKQREEQLKRR